MTIDKITVKLFGKKETLYRAIDADGEVIRVFESPEDAQAWVDAQ